MLSLALAHGANARAARLIAEDDIWDRQRERLRKRLGYNSLLSRWLKCPWCCGFATSALIVTPIAWFPIMGLHYWWIFGLAVWSVAHAGGRLNHNHGKI